jgi:hypothetical protein
MDHNQAIREFEHLMEKQAEHAQSAATELEALLQHLPNGKTRQLAGEQIKASRKQAKEFREMAKQA